MMFTIFILLYTFWYRNHLHVYFLNRKIKQMNMIKGYARTCAAPNKKYLEFVFENHRRIIRKVQRELNHFCFIMTLL